MLSILRYQEKGLPQKEEEKTQADLTTLNRFSME